ncbi:MAG: hypothetical protein QW524_03745, partial [Candidatus Woesearchaeota archaeon]
ICQSDESPFTCPQDCGVPAYCGDGICQSDESPFTCPQDCGMPAYCGDGICQSDESPFTCPQDCGVPAYCGDGICQPDESPFTCPQDCGVPAYCGDGICQPDESPFTCPQDCGFPNRDPQIIVNDRYVVREGEILNYTIRVLDEDGDDVELSWQGIPRGSVVRRISGVEWVHEWQPDYNASGRYVVVYEARDSRGGSSRKEVEIEVIDVIERIESELICFDKVLDNSMQACSLRIFGIQNGQIIPLSLEVNFYDEYNSQSTFKASCITDVLSGGCSVFFPVNGIGRHRIISSFNYESIQYNTTFDYEIFNKRYEILELTTYNDSRYSMVSNEFYRGQNLYLTFKIFDLFTNNYVNISDIVKDVVLVSEKGGRINLSFDFIDLYRYHYFVQIPTTHDFFGGSNVFVIVFDFSDNTIGEAYITLIIKNNKPLLYCYDIKNLESVLGQTLEISNFTQIKCESWDIEDIPNYEYSVYPDTIVSMNVTHSIMNNKSIMFFDITPVNSGFANLSIRVCDMDQDCNEGIIGLAVTQQKEEENYEIKEILFLGSSDLNDRKTVFYRLDPLYVALKVEKNNETYFGHMNVSFNGQKMRFEQIIANYHIFSIQIPNNKSLVYDPGLLLINIGNDEFEINLSKHIRIENRVPNIIVSSQIIVPLGEAILIPITVEDEDDVDLTIKTQGLLANLIFLGDNKWILNVTVMQEGQYEINLSATDPFVTVHKSIVIFTEKVTLRSSDLEIKVLNHKTVGSYNLFTLKITNKNPIPVRNLKISVIGKSSEKWPIDTISILNPQETITRNFWYPSNIKGALVMVYNSEIRKTEPLS